jgi:hypothetical protein
VAEVWKTKQLEKRDAAIRESFRPFGSRLPCERLSFERVMSISESTPQTWNEPTYLRRDAKLGVAIQHHLLQLRQPPDLDGAELKIVFAQIRDDQLSPLEDVALHVHDLVLAQMQLAQLRAEAQLLSCVLRHRQSDGPRARIVPSLHPMKAISRRVSTRLGERMRRFMDVERDRETVCIRRGYELVSQSGT